MVGTILFSLPIAVHFHLHGILKRSIATGVVLYTHRAWWTPITASPAKHFFGRLSIQCKWLGFTRYGLPLLPALFLGLMAFFTRGEPSSNASQD